MPLTPTSTLTLAFPASLLPPVPLPPGLLARPLSSTDHSRNHLTLLTALTQAPDLGYQAWLDQFNRLLACPDTYYPLVFVDEQTDELVATGMLLLERKFIRANGLVGHIEDIAVSPSQQGKGLGRLLIEGLTELSERLGAYKVSRACWCMGRGVRRARATGFGRRGGRAELTGAVLNPTCQTILDCDPKNEGE